MAQEGDHQKLEHRVKGIILRKSESQAVACIAVVFGD